MTTGSGVSHAETKPVAVKRDKQQIINVISSIITYSFSISSHISSFAKTFQLECTLIYVYMSSGQSHSFYSHIS